MFHASCFMIFNVPQFIDIEDKIVGPLTAKQLGWLALGGVILLVCYALLDASAFAISAVIVITIFSALAFYRPYNQPLIKFIFSSLLFATRPKRYIWRRLPEKMKRTPIKENSAPPIPKKKFDPQKASTVSDLLDMKKK